MDNFLLFESALDEYNKKTSSEINNNNSKDKIVNNINDLEDEDEDDNEYNYETLSSNIEDEPELLETFEESKNKEECEHKNMANENGNVICFDCGKELEKSVFQDKEWRYYGVSDSKRSSDPNRVHIRKVDDRSIYKDVENMGFSDKIIYLANQLYIQVTKGQIFRGNSRKAIVFACIFHSFKIQGKPQSHEKLIKIFQLNKKTGLKGLKFVNLNAPKESLIHTTYITPINIIEDIMDKFEATRDQKNEVVDLYNKIKNKSSKINRSRPQSIASGLVYFWISFKNIDVSIKNFAKKADLSELTILKLAKEISDILGVIPESWL
jgi:transcription initiation factor TFIIIB Brf1 subunit/transcription initiation factor TFIIB